MGNSPSASAPANAPAVPQANAPAVPQANAPANVPANAPAVPQANMASLSSNSKKNNSKTVVQVPAENVTVTKGGKRRRLRGGVASVHFDLIPRLQPSDAVMDRVTSAPAGYQGGRRSTRHKSKSKRHGSKRHGSKRNRR